MVYKTRYLVLQDEVPCPTRRGTLSYEVPCMYVHAPVPRPDKVTYTSLTSLSRFDGQFCVESNVNCRSFSKWLLQGECVWIFNLHISIWTKGLATRTSISKGSRCRDDVRGVFDLPTQHSVVIHLQSPQWLWRKPHQHKIGLICWMKLPSWLCARKKTLGILERRFLLVSGVRVYWRGRLLESNIKEQTHTWVALEQRVLPWPGSIKECTAWCVWQWYRPHTHTHLPVSRVVTSAVWTGEMSGVNWPSDTRLAKLGDLRVYCASLPHICQVQTWTHLKS